MIQLLKVMEPMIGGIRSFHTGFVAEAARKGTRLRRAREKRAYNLAKIAAAKSQPPKPVVKNIKNLKNLKSRLDEDVLEFPSDDVYTIHQYKRKEFPFNEAVEMHRQHFHPTMLNMPKADLIAFVELDLRTAKKTKFIGSFSSIVLYPKPFVFAHERKILALTVDEQSVEESWKAGATMAYGPECVRMAQAGKINFKEYDYIIAHSQLLPQLIHVRKMLKTNFPSPTAGTAGPDVVPLIEHFAKGYEYSLQKHPIEFDYGWINAKIGTLDTPIDDLETNLQALLIDIENKRPKTKPNDMITKVWLKVIEKEKFKVPYQQYFEKTKPSKVQEDGDDVNEKELEKTAESF